MIVLTSFKEASVMKNVVKLGGARWGPPFAGGWPEVEWMKPKRKNGTAVLLRNFGSDPLVPYHDYMLDLYRERWPAVRRWLGEYAELDVAVACWCPNTKTARAQIANFGTFHCHMGVVGDVLTAAGVAWEYGVEHETMMVRG